MREEEGSLAGPGTPGSVLIVSDNRETSGLVAEFLRREGYAVGCIDNVFVADSALDDLDMYLEDTFDVILLDVTLAGIDAVDLLQSVQARGISIPSIVLTASSDEAHWLETLKAGAFDYVSEPVDFAYLGTTVAAAVAYQARHNRALGEWQRQE
jgi:DNA-binding response OmpR family regulator